jgi:hypothetical protein
MLVPLAPFTSPQRSRCADMTRRRAGVEVAAVIGFLLQMGFQSLHQPYECASLSAPQQQVVSDLSALGVLFLYQHKDQCWYYPTKLAAHLAGTRLYIPDIIAPISCGRAPVVASAGHNCVCCGLRSHGGTRGWRGGSMLCCCWCIRSCPALVNEELLKAEPLVRDTTAPKWLVCLSENSKRITPLQLVLV